MDVSSRRRFRQLGRWALAGFVVSAGILLAWFFLARGDRDAQSPQAHRFPDARYVTPPLDQLIWWNSFSEVEQTKAILRGLALQSIGQIRTSYLRSRVEPDPQSRSSGTPARPDPALGVAIDRVLRRLDEFRGTEQSTLFYGELFRLLRRAGQHDRWLDRYLELIYHQPTDPLILQEARSAHEAARVTRRDAELRAALDHWNRIPPKYRDDASGITTDPAGDHAR